MDPSHLGTFSIYLSVLPPKSACTPCFIWHLPQFTSLKLTSPFQKLDSHFRQFQAHKQCIEMCRRRHSSREMTLSSPASPKRLYCFRSSFRSPTFSNEHRQERCGFSRTFPWQWLRDCRRHMQSTIAWIQRLMDGFELCVIIPLAMLTTFLLIFLVSFFSKIPLKSLSATYRSPVKGYCSVTIE